MSMDSVVLIRHGLRIFENFGPEILAISILDKFFMKKVKNKILTFFGAHTGTNVHWIDLE